MTPAPRRLAWAVLPALLSVSRVTIAAAAGLSVDTSNRDAVVAFYDSVYRTQDPVESRWSGNVASCSAGDVSASYRAAAVRRVNFFRAMAGLPADIRLREDWDAKCQDGALMLNANQQLSHSPPRSWRCFSDDGAEALSHSDIAYGYATAWDAVTAWIADPGIVTGGHRRWLLYPPASQMGFGCTFGGSYRSYAMWVVGGEGVRPASPDWVAWPPPGYVPYTLVPNLWSLSFPGADFRSATVWLTREGSPVELQLQPVADGYADNTLVWAVAEFPAVGPAPDTRYHVVVDDVVIDGAPRRFEYETVVFDPGGSSPVVDRSRQPLPVLGADPNPFAGSVRIRYELSQDSDVQLAIYDAAGRLVRELYRGHRASGTHQIEWDGRDRSGMLVGAGSYLCRIRAGDRVRGTHILRIHGAGRS